MGVLQRAVLGGEKGLMASVYLVREKFLPDGLYMEMAMVLMVGSFAMANSQDFAIHSQP